MPTLPPGPPRKTPELDHKGRVRIVINALLGLRRKGASGVVELERTNENQLTKLNRGEIIIELERISDKNRPTFRIMRAGHTVKSAAKPASLQVGFSEPKYQWAQWRDIPEKTPIVLALLDGFDNWCEAQFRKQSLTITDLSEDSFRKVLYATVDIYQQFELTSAPVVKIGWVEADPSRTKEARRQALEFLDDKDAIKRYSFQSVLGTVEIEISINEFLKFTDELRSLPLPNSGSKSADEKPAAVTSHPFATADVVKWQDITIQFVNGHEARVTVGSISKTLGFKEMGFEDERKRLPNIQWELLRLLANRKGQISWGDSEAADKVRKQKQQLAGALKDFFRIDEDPFYPYKEAKAYRIKLKLKAEGD